MVELTNEEKAAIEYLQRIAKWWPKSLQLFSWSGSLHVMKPGDGRTYEQASVARVTISSDGGDPDGDEECI